VNASGLRLPEDVFVTPDQLPQMGFDTFEVSLMLGLTPRGARRDSVEARRGMDNVKTLIRNKKLGARWSGKSWRIYTTHLIAYMSGADDPSVARAS
jgi:hypothetical protein